MCTPQRADALTKLCLFFGRLPFSFAWINQINYCAPNQHLIPAWLDAMHMPDLKPKVLPARHLILLLVLRESLAGGIKREVRSPQCLP
jgi:hypothetical protein